MRPTLPFHSSFCGPTIKLRPIYVSMDILYIRTVQCFLSITETERDCDVALCRVILIGKVLERENDVVVSFGGLGTELAAGHLCVDGQDAHVLGVCTQFPLPTHMHTPIHDRGWFQKCLCVIISAV